MTKKSKKNVALNVMILLTQINDAGLSCLANFCCVKEVNE